MSISLRSLIFLRTRLHLLNQPCSTYCKTLVSASSCCNPYNRKNTAKKRLLGCDSIVSTCKRFHLRSYSSQHGVELSMKHDIVRSYIKHLNDKYDAAAQVLSSSDEDTRQESQEEAKKSLGNLAAIADLYKQYEDIRQQYEELQNMMESGKDDPEMKKMLDKEISETWESLMELDQHIMLHVVPPDFGDQCDAIMELNAGAGGQEAMLFTGEIYNMYESFAAYKGWSFEQIDVDQSPVGGLRKATVSMSGHNIYKIMKYEGGVHRVQRNPKTEKSGRLHTSTMSVAVLPTPTEVDIVIRPGDLKIDTFRASGAGGQHVNTTDSAVRITHKPTGMAVECQVQRSQFKNKEIALKILRTRLYDTEVAKQMDEQQAKRKIQTGTRARSEKIRTYNFNQDRITDHRLSGNMHNLPGFMMGGEQLDEMIERLMEASRLERLKEILNQFEKNSKS